MTNPEVIALIGSTMLAVCAAPAAWEAIKTKQCFVNKWMLHLWMIGEVLCLGYAIEIGGPMLPLILNYSFNIVCLIPMIYYRKDANV